MIYDSCTEARSGGLHGKIGDRHTIVAPFLVVEFYVGRAASAKISVFFQVRFQRTFRDANGNVVFVRRAVANCDFVVFSHAPRLA